MQSWLLAANRRLSDQDLPAMSSDIVFLYDQVIEALVRLHAFSCMRVGELGGGNDTEEDIDHVAELIAKRDLLTFAASTRNFAEATKAVADMRSIGVPTCKLKPLPATAPFFAEGSETITLYQTLSRILHAGSIELLRSTADYEFQLASSDEEYLQMIGRRRGRATEKSEPLVLLRSEKDLPALLRLRSMILRTCAFLNVISDRLAEERSIYLQRDYRDL
ncbi:MAG: hypothetical protein HY852_00375 [Bradyrhizobium sp.]|uniref:hypothetical protein n=1 Tax=Bradyrhizobium sp. TaxID=376 RepID=UPI0025BDF8A6|nr:hypothetical protein [Bradyrhizobium sp.]MBI5260256.1 hypothetical protein [Bradyrhizobium sp.]